METAHKLIIIWGMVAGAWSRGSIKLRTENPVPGETGLVHRRRLCWPLAKKACHWDPGMVGWNWSSSCNPPAGDLTFCRKCKSFYCDLSCYQGCCSSIVIDLGYFCNCSVVWNFGGPVDPCFVEFGAKTSFVGFEWPPRHCPRLLPVGQLGSWMCPGLHVSSEVRLWLGELLCPDPGCAWAASWSPSWDLVVGQPGTGLEDRIPPHSQTRAFLYAWCSACVMVMLPVWLGMGSWGASVYPW